MDRMKMNSATKKTTRIAMKIAKAMIDDDITTNPIDGKAILAMPLVTTYKGVQVYLNGNDHRPPHLVTICPKKPNIRANFCINNGTDPKYTDGQLLNISDEFDKGKLKDIKEWFTPENRPERMKKIMEYIVVRGEPSWFKIEEIFTPDELKKYEALKKEHEQKNDKDKQASIITALRAIDLSKPWSPENDYDKITEIQRIIANDDYTLTVFFNDGSKKLYDVKDKIFNKNNQDFLWFKKLQDINEFKKAEECGWAVRWDDDTDISSYELYVHGK